MTRRTPLPNGEVVSIYMTSELRAQLQDVALREHRSVSAQAVVLIQIGLSTLVSQEEKEKQT